MKITLERKNDPILRSLVYVLSVGTHKYLYEKLEDVLFRQTVLFEPRQEEGKTKSKREEKPKKKYIKKSDKFPLGDSLLQILPDPSAPPMRLDTIMKSMERITPKKFRDSVYRAVLGRLVNKGVVNNQIIKGEKVYWRAK